MPTENESMEALQESRELLRVTLASIGDAVITTDPQGRVTFLNPVAEALTGWTQEEAANRSLEQIFRIVNQESRAEVENPALRCLHEGTIVGLANHTILIAKDGAERNIDDSAAPIRNAHGEVAGAVLVFRDITERYKQEQTIRQALDYATNIINTARHAFLVLDGNLRVVSANRSFYRHFQVTPQQTEGRLVFELGNGQWNTPKLRQLLEEILPRNQGFEDFEVEHDFDTIGRKIMAVNARCIDRPGNDSQLILMAIEDITERKRAEEAAARLAAIVTSSDDSIISLDVDGIITSWNKGAEKLFGYTSEEAVGKSVTILIPPERLDEEPRILARIHRGKAVEHYETVRQRKDGSPLEISLSASPIKNAAGQVIGVSKIARDITERVRLMHQIAQQSEAIASESRRKDEFLAMLSHELRNPLAPIRTAVHLLRLQERGSENLIQRQAHEIIERQVANITKLVSDLLEVSRVISGRIRLNQQTVDLNQVVRQAFETVTSLIEERQHKLELHLGEAPVWTRADVTRLEEVFVNLLTNAAKYTPDNGQIVVDCEHPHGTNYAQVRVRDNGVGIDEELLPRIFDLFTQADRSLDRSQGGLGIGLSLTHRLVELHGGTIEAHSPPEGHGQGSEFIVTLAVSPAPESVEPVVPMDAPARPDGMRVLVVDDNTDLVIVLASTLRQKGYRVQSAHTGPDGLKVAQQWRPDVIILDIGLPELDGYQVARRLRADESTKDARIIALTGYGRDADIELAREAGFDAHLVKPHDVDELEKLMVQS